MITEDVSALKIHNLTQEQYDRELAAGNLDENALYFTMEGNNGYEQNIEVVVTTAAGATVYYSDEDGNSYSVNADSNGRAIISPTKYGTYSFYAVSGDSQSNTVTLTVDMVKQYKLNLSFYKYYGVKIEIGISDPEAALTYIDDAEGMSAGWDNWKDTVIFKDIKPCVLKDGVVQYYLNPDDYTKKEDGTASTLDSTTAGDVMVEIPKLGYKMTKDSSCHYIWITDDPNADGYCYAAHSKESEGDCDKIYIGAYLGFVSSDEKLYSISDVVPTTDIDISSFCSYTTITRGDGYELFSFYPLTLLQCLYLLIFKNRDSQTALGQGYVGGSNGRYTGGTNSSGFMYGSTSTTSRVKFLGLEDFWGNYSYWVDGIYCDSSCNILTHYKNITEIESGANYQYSYPTGASDEGIYNYMSDIIGTNHGGFVIKAASGSDSTYYADYADLYPDAYACFGGDWNEESLAGIFYLNISNAGGTGYISARLLYKHLAQ